MKRDRGLFVLAALVALIAMLRLLPGCAPLRAFLGVAAPLVAGYAEAAARAKGGPLSPDEDAGLRALVAEIAAARASAVDAATKCSTVAPPPADPAELELQLRASAAAQRDAADARSRVAVLEEQLAAGVAELRRTRELATADAGADQ